MNDNRLTDNPTLQSGNGPDLDGSREHWPAVSIVLPVYNSETVLSACLDSLLAMDYPNDLREIIVVNNASTDGTGRVLDDYRDKVRVLDEPKRGVSYARNAGIRAATHDPIAFIDADCVADPAWLRGIVRPLLNDEGISMVGGKILAMPGANAIERFGDKIHDHRKAIEFYRPPYVIMMNVALRRSVLDDIGLFDPLFLRAQDTDLSFRLYLGGHRLSYAPDAIVFHRNESTLQALFHEGFKHGMWQICLYRKHSDNLMRNRPRINTKDYKRLGNLFASAARTLRKNRYSEATEVCELIFFAGKKVGHIAGSIRFRYLRL